MTHTGGDVVVVVGPAVVVVVVVGVAVVVVVVVGADVVVVVGPEVVVVVGSAQPPPACIHGLLYIGAPAMGSLQIGSFEQQSVHDECTTELMGTS
jgi:hypothetical protein